MVRGVIGWRVLAALALTVAFGAVAAGCGSGSAASSNEEKIAFLLPSDYAARYEGRAGFEKRVQKLCGRCQVLYDNAQGSTSQQQSQAEQALEEGAGVLVVDPVDPRAAAGIVQKARGSSVPVLSYARLILNSKVDYYVGVDHEQLGRLQGESLAAKLQEEGKPKGPIVMAEVGAGGLQAAGARTILDSAGVKIARSYKIDESASEAAASSLARRETKSAIAGLGVHGFAGVLAPSDAVAAGAIAALKGAGIDPKVTPTTGAGATLPAVRRVLTGQQLMSAYEASGQVGFAAAEMAVKLVKGGKVPAAMTSRSLDNGLEKVPAVLLGATIVDAENLNSTVIPYGFVKPAQLCAGNTAKYCARAEIPTS
jgi:D-xylose transport system substrate-binding protein